MDTGSYNCKEFVFSKDLLVGQVILLILACTVCCRRQCVRSSLNPFTRINVSFVFSSADVL